MLATVAGVATLLGVLCFFGTAIPLILIVALGAKLGEIAWTVPLVLLGNGLGLLIFGQITRVLLDIEANTRAQVELLEKADTLRGQRSEGS